MSKVVLSFFVWLVQIQSGFAYILIPPGGDTPVELVNMDNKFSVNTLLGNYIAYAIGIAGVLGVIGVTW